MAELVLEKNETFGHCTKRLKVFFEFGALTEQPNARGASNYWAKLKERLKKEGADQLLTNCQQLKLKATDGKRRLTDVANIGQLLRIIQSVPSKKAEPLKIWLAEVGRERMEENSNLNFQ